LKHTEQSQPKRKIKGGDRTFTHQQLYRPQHQAPQNQQDHKWAALLKCDEAKDEGKNVKTREVS
jgi:hypothetical protein